MNEMGIKILKLNVLEAHDRLLHLKKTQSETLAQGCEDCLKKNPLSIALQEKSPYIYIFAHPRTANDGINKRMLWQPRLTKPKAQTNSYLFRALSKTDILEICWMIPPREHWKQSEKGKVAENEIIQWSVDMFLNKRKELERKHPEDLEDDQCMKIYKTIQDTKKYKKI